MARIDIPAISFDLIAIKCTLSVLMASKRAYEREKYKDRTKGMMKQGPNIMSILFDGRFLIAADTHTYVRECVFRR